MSTGTQDAALLVVDVQNDFCTGGSLAVPNADQVVPVLNGYIDEAVAARMPVYLTRDWHPAITIHFTQYGGPWPRHCVQQTEGARFHPELRLPPGAIIVNKGVDPGNHGYSAFEGRTSDGTPLLADLETRGIHHILIGGLTTDYCVRQSVLYALMKGFKVTVLEDAIAGVNASDSARAIIEMREHGASFRRECGP